MDISSAKKLLRSLIGDDCYQEISDIVNSYFDVAQKQIATTVDFIERSVEAKGPGTITLPENSMRIARVKSENDSEFEIKSSKAVELLSDDDYTVYYYAYPTVLDDSTPDSYEFEVSPEAHSAIVFFAAANAVITDNDMRPYYAFNDRYNNILENIASAKRTGGAVKVVSLGG